jgi:DNA-binding XRE family transcriptional regulator
LGLGIVRAFTRAVPMGILRCYYFVTVLRQITTGLRMNAVQCKMARAAVGIGVRELATAAKISPDTVSRLERGEVLRGRTVDTIRAALEPAGVEFTNGKKPGVRLKKADRVIRATWDPPPKT